MFTFFIPIKKPLDIQVENYCAWKGLRFQNVATEHKRVLRSFSKRCGVRTVSDITLEDILTFSNTFASDYYRMEVIHTIRQFLRYCYTMGISCVQLEPVKPTGILPTHMQDKPVTAIEKPKVHPLLHVDQVRRVKRLRDELQPNGKKRTFREVKTIMESQDKRRYDVKNISLWYHRELPDGV